METTKSQQFPIYWIFIITGMLLFIPLIAMQFTDEVNWGPLDFLVAAILLLSTGMAIRWLIWKQEDLIFRLGAIMAILSTFLLIWSNLAVGLIGSGPNLPNLLFGLVPFIGIYGSIHTNFSPKGLFRTMVAMTLAILAIAIIFVLLNNQETPKSSEKEILLVSGFFSFLFLLSAMLFKASEKRGKNAS